MKKIILDVADGTKMQAFVSEPTSAANAAVIVLQEAFGVNHHIQELTKRFAAEGYLAIAPELFHRTVSPGTSFGYDQFPLVSEHLAALTPKGMQQDTQACYDWLKQTYNVKAIAASGYCMGGRAAFMANATVPLSCAISYYGGRINQSLELAKEQKSPLLFFWGGLDKHIPQEQIETVMTALTTAEKKFTNVKISDADHGFFCDERASYNPSAARQSWALTLEFLKEHNR